MKLRTILTGIILATILLAVACRSSSTPEAPTPESQATATSTPESEAASANIIEAATPKTLSEQPGSQLADTPVSVVTAQDLPRSSLFEIDWDDRSVFKTGLIESEQAILDDLPGASIYHLEIEVADDLHLISGREAVRYTNMEGEPLNEVYFHLYPNLLGGYETISDVTVNGQTVEPSYELNSSAMKVPLPQPLQPGEQVVIGMGFTSSVPQSQERNYGIFASVDGILALAHFYPLIAVYEEGGWDIETPSPNGDVVYADTAFYIVRVAAPPEQTVIASGVTIDQTRSDEAQSVTFAGGPMRDFYVVSSGRYEVVSRSVGDTAINSYFLPGQREAGELALQYAADSLESFNDRYGIYPFTEFDVAPTANQALGIEYPGIVAINLLLYDLDGRLGDIPTSVFFESTVAHEVGHQWFYSLVGNDQLEEPWVDEALTQYATWRYYLDMYGQGGADGFREALVSRLERLERREERSIPIGKAVDEYELPQYSAIVYGRGPLFFEALAEEIGQDTVDEFLRDYALTYRWDIATSEDLQRMAEAHCRCDLSQLFDEWVYGE